nr:hypothetical protein [uncultured Mediterraneibacter sp.]
MRLLILEDMEAVVPAEKEMGGGTLHAEDQQADRGAFKSEVCDRQ